MTRFIRKKINDTPIEDTVFAIVKKAAEDRAKNGPDKVIDATIGSLFGEDGKLVAFKTVFEHYDQIESSEKAKYAASFRGNPDFREAAYNWLVQNVEVKLEHSVIATPGGSGAVSTTMIDCLDQSETLLIPEIAWGSYKLMAEMNNYKVETYSLFDGDVFNIKDFKEKCEKIVAAQHKLVVIINDPCHNPTGYSLTRAEWDNVVEILNDCGKQGPTVLLNDIAYIDYSYDFAHSRDYLAAFNNISNNVCVIVALSCSKTLTSYGLRCGAAIILAKDPADVRQIEIVMEKTARATWSNIPNAAMDNFVYITGEGREEYLKEEGKYVELLRQRSRTFADEARACGLQYYPYKEGFFITLKMDNDTRDKFHEALMANHIYTVKVNKGIRVAVCSLSLDKVNGLASKMKVILDEQ